MKKLQDKLNKKCNCSKKCSRCNGKGYLVMWGLIVQIVMDGVDKMEETHKYKKIRTMMDMGCLFGKCPKCSLVLEDGRGIHQVAIYDIYEVTEKTPCGQCEGTGEQKEDCDLCSGTGECPDCDGTGTDYRTCQTCKGKKEYWEESDGQLIGSESELR
jgi:DnaJ-class molecular chaperone